MKVTRREARITAIELLFDYTFNRDSTLEERIELALDNRELKYNDFSEKLFKVTDELTASAPTLLPIYSHRYVPMLENIIDPPVISTVGIDTIMYGKNQFDYLQNEFIKSQIDPIPFWNGIILNLNKTKTLPAGSVFCS